MRERTDGRFLNLITSDEYPAYATAIAQVYAEAQPSSGGRPAAKRLPPELVYATVHKTREGNRVVKVEARRGFGTGRGLAAGPGWGVLALVAPGVVGGATGAGRRPNSREVRKS